MTVNIWILELEGGGSLLMRGVPIIPCTGDTLLRKAWDEGIKAVRATPCVCQVRGCCKFSTDTFYRELAFAFEMKSTPYMFEGEKAYAVCSVHGDRLKKQTRERLFILEERIDELGDIVERLEEQMYSCCNGRWED